jgi:hypothetical protein
MAECHGQSPVSTKVDEETIRYIDEKASEAGVTRAEFLRLLVDLYRASDDGSLPCAACGSPLNLPGVIS